MVLGTRVLLFGIIGFVSVCVLVVGILASSYVSNADYGNKAEQQIKAEYTRAQNVLSNAATSIMDIAKINERYADDVKEIVERAMSAREGYGEGSSVAILQESSLGNILTNENTTQINNIILSKRTDFETAQNRLIDVTRSYETNLGSVYKGFFLRMAGYPKIDLSDYQIILDQSTRDKFESGVDSGFIQ